MCGGGHADKPVIILFQLGKKIKVDTVSLVAEERRKGEWGPPAKWWDATEKNPTRWYVGGGGCGVDGMCMSNCV